MPNRSQVAGLPQPLGSTWLESEQCFNFALYSRHATRVTLLIYTADDLINPALRGVFLAHQRTGLRGRFAPGNIKSMLAAFKKSEAL
jgi:hypothetical protein